MTTCKIILPFYVHIRCFYCFSVLLIFCLEYILGENEVTQSCLTLCDPVNCSLPSSSIHGILQSRILEWVAIAFSRGSSQPRDQTQVSRVAGRHFTIWATREAQHIYMHHIFFIHLSVDGHLGCSHVCLLYIVLQLIWRCMYLFELCFSLIYAPEWDCRIIW